MLLTVTPNAAIDRTYMFGAFRLNQVNRPTDMRVSAGGKGINVARVFHRLGGSVATTGFLAGEAGHAIQAWIEEEGLHPAFEWLPGESRTCITAMSRKGSTQTELNECGPDAQQASGRLLARIERMTRDLPADTVALCGSLPENAPESLFADAVCLVQAAGRRAVVDTSAPSLTSCLAAKPWVVKVNRIEAERALGIAIAPGVAAELARAARELRLHGARIAVVTDGGAGAALACSAGTWFAAPPTIRFKSAVGSGDAFFAGLLFSISAAPEADSACQALQLATAAGAANAEVIGSGFCTRRRILTLLPRVNVVRCPQPMSA
ncbi:MAG: hexose kinase [Armatimonadetes bacterium]|nr:hexose kinase [Armatimonadota bacterium]MDE2207638.1 hexose kinase [Armatimonadota bacterium]